MDIYEYAGCKNFSQSLRDSAATYGITDDDVPYWLGQLSVESTNFTRTTENLNYHAQGLLNVLNGRNGVDTLDKAQAAINGGASSVAEALYGGSWGASRLGNVQPGDAFKFIGHGLVQITGRWNHNSVSAKIYGDDRLVQTPELLTLAEGAAVSAAWFYESRGCIGMRDVAAITQRINGGHEGLAQRQEATARLLAYNPAP